MKRLTIWISLTLVCFALSASASDEIPAKYSDCLYPIRVGGKWGYMNYAGETVIKPQWNSVDVFANGVASVTISGGDHPFVNNFTFGLIDTKGNYILEPKYRIYQSGSFFHVDVPGEDGKQKEGYYDAVSGFFLEPAYDIIADWMVTDDTPLILAERDGLYGFLDRATGKEVIPLQYSWFDRDEEVRYSEGYVLAADEVSDWEDRFINIRFYLLDAEGNHVHFPEGTMPCSPVRDGIVKIVREVNEGERSWWNSLYGFARTDGTILVPPKYDDVKDFCNGYAAVYKDGKWGHIDSTGREIVPPTYALVGDDITEGYFFHDGYAILDLDEEWLIIDTLGNVVFERARQEDGMSFYLEGWCKAGKALLSYSLWPQEPADWNHRYGLMKADGTIVTDAIWEDDPLFWGPHSYGDLLLVKKDGLWGYVDAKGADVLPFLWEDAQNFKNGLAYVEKDGKMAYIDHGGNVVWHEE